MNPDKVRISTPFIRLDSLLKFAGIAQTGGHAKMMVEDGAVLVNGAVCTVRGKKLYPGDRVECDGQTLAVESA